MSRSIKIRVRVRDWVCVGMVRDDHFLRRSRVRDRDGV